MEHPRNTPRHMQIGFVTASDGRALAQVADEGGGVLIGIDTQFSFPDG